MRCLKPVALVLYFLCITGSVHAQLDQRVRDVVYEKVGNETFTFDILKPAKPNGTVVIWIVSGGWFSLRDWIDESITGYFNLKGQTVFAVVHGSWPKYTLPDMVLQVQRAVRFIRAHATEYGVDPNRIGIAGGSSGGHLALMVAAQGTPLKTDPTDPYRRVSSRVQAAAVLYPFTNFMDYDGSGHNIFLDLETSKLKDFAPAFPITPTTSKEERERLSRVESPVTYLTNKMPSTLIIHGEADDLVPIQQSRDFATKLDELKVRHQLIEREGKGHGWPDGGPDFLALADWFQIYLSLSRTCTCLSSPGQ